MRLLSFLLIAFFASSTINAQNPTCRSLQTGSFRITSKESGTTYIKRTKKEQVEKNDEAGVEIVFSIVWLDECTYELRPKKLIKGDPAIMGDGTDYVRSRIKRITPKSYVAETTASFTEGKTDILVEILD